jgi:hypothetical protein
MKYEIQICEYDGWCGFAMADRFDVAVSICEWQQDLNIDYVNVKFRIVEVATNKISVV